MLWSHDIWVELIFNRLDDPSAGKDTGTASLIVELFLLLQKVFQFLFLIPCCGFSSCSYNCLCYYLCCCFCYCFLLLLFSNCFFYCYCLLSKFLLVHDYFFIFYKLQLLDVRFNMNKEPTNLINYRVGQFNR
jgi:hypothetical protein